MDFTKILTSSLALIFVLCVIGLVSMALRKYGSNLTVNMNKKGGRLQVKEVLNIDARKKIVLIGKDEKEYLVAFNENAIEVVDGNDKKDN